MTTHKDFISIPVDDTLKQIMRQAVEKGMPPTDLIRQVLEAYVVGTIPVGFLNHAEAFFGLLFEFLEELPLEVTLKTVENDKIIYVWANRRFRMMARIDNAQDVLGKTAKDIWPRRRAETIEQLDREVLMKEPSKVAHFDTVRVGKGTTRMRVGLRFRLGRLFQNYPVLGSIGMDFSSKDAARKAARTLLLEWGEQVGNTDAGRQVPKKKRPRS
jgi:hypothetical protein